MRSPWGLIGVGSSPCKPSTRPRLPGICDPKNRVQLTQLTQFHSTVSASRRRRRGNLLPARAEIAHLHSLALPTTLAPAASAGGASVHHTLAVARKCHGVQVPLLRVTQCAGVSLGPGSDQTLPAPSSARPAGSRREKSTSWTTPGSRRGVYLPVHNQPDTLADREIVPPARPPQ